jgi:hypothetical protein
LRVVVAQEIGKEPPDRIHALQRPSQPKHQFIAPLVYFSFPASATPGAYIQLDGNKQRELSQPVVQELVQAQPDNDGEGKHAL